MTIIKTYSTDGQRNNTSAISQLLLLERKSRIPTTDYWHKPSVYGHTYKKTTKKKRNTHKDFRINNDSKPNCVHQEGVKHHLTIQVNWLNITWCLNTVCNWVWGGREHNQLPWSWNYTQGAANCAKKQTNKKKPWPFFLTIKLHEPVPVWKAMITNNKYIDILYKSVPWKMVPSPNPIEGCQYF